MAEIYEETKNVIRKGEDEKEEFWTSKGVRQGCSMCIFQRRDDVYIWRRKQRSHRREEQWWGSKGLILDMYRRRSIASQLVGSRDERNDEEATEIHRKERADIEHKFKMMMFERNRGSKRKKRKWN